MGGFRVRSESRLALLDSSRQRIFKWHSKKFLNDPYSAITMLNKLSWPKRDSFINPYFLFKCLISPTNYQQTSQIDFYIFARLPLYTCLFWQPHHVLFLLSLSFPWILFLFTQCGHHFDINYNGKTIPHHSLATMIPRNFVITKKLKRRVWYFFGDNRGSLSKGSCLTVQSVSYNPIMTAITGFRLSSVNNINLGLYEGVAISCAGDNEMFANELTNNSFNQDRVKSRALFH